MRGSTSGQFPTKPPGIPTWFWLQCLEASAAVESGGYRTPGYHLALHLLEFHPKTVGRDEWRELVQVELSSLIEANDDAAVVAWLSHRYRRFMILVPARRRLRFVAGFRAGLEDKGVLRSREDSNATG